MKESKTLPLLLILLIVLFGCAVAFLRMENKNLSEDILVQNQRMKKSTVTVTEKKEFDQDSWFEFINREQARFYEKDVDDRIYSLGQEVSNLIENHNLKIEFYNILEKNGRRYFNYTVTGNIQSCITLIQSLSRDKAYYDLDTVSIENKSETASMSILFTPATIKEFEGELDELYNVELPYSELRISTTPRDLVSRLFYTRPAVTSKPDEVVIKEPQDEKEFIPNAPYWLSYVGHSVENESDQYYFLDTRTNKTIEIIPNREENAFKIIQNRYDGFNILLSGEKYYVSKN